jgi:hypothetical protein
MQIFVIEMVPTYQFQFRRFAQYLQTPYDTRVAAGLCFHTSANGDTNYKQVKVEHKNTKIGKRQ